MSICAALVTFLTGPNGGYLTAADLAAHCSEWVDPVSTNYRGYDVWELPPNTQGIAALQMLNILEAYDLEAMGFGIPEYLHLFVEAEKVRSHKPVVLRRGNDEFTADHLDYDNLDRVLELRGRVRGQIGPRAPG